MKITGYSVQTGSSHKLEKSKDISEKLEMWQGKRRDAAKDEPSFALDLGSAQKTCGFEKSALTGDGENAQDPASEVKLKLIESFIYMTTGKRVKLKSPELAAMRKEEPILTDPDAVMADARDGWGLMYEYHEVTSEQESVFFNSAGMVSVADGRQISFEMDFTMSRTFCQQQEVSLRLGGAAQMDPLVVALEGNPSLTENKFGFDLDNDGQDDNISMPKDGSAFLAYDKNGNDEIDNGSELFGPESGDGFTELRMYDLDKNGWLDENDPLFSSLRLYSLSEDGGRTLFKLDEAGIGAIYLNDLSTLYNFKNSQGVSAGEMISSSIFLKENGTVGTIHHIDLTI